MNFQIVDMNIGKQSQNFPRLIVCQQYLGRLRGNLDLKEPLDVVSADLIDMTGASRAFLPWSAFPSAMCAVLGICCIRRVPPFGHFFRSDKRHISNLFAVMASLTIKLINLKIDRNHCSGSNSPSENEPLLCIR